MKYIIIFVVLVIYSLATTYGNNSIKIQELPPDPIKNPEAKAIAFAVIGTNDILNKNILENFKNVELPHSYFQIKLRQMELSRPAVNVSAKKDISDINKKKLVVWLNKNKAGQKILSEWFNRQPEGHFNLDIFEKYHSFSDSEKKILTGNQAIPKSLTNKIAGSPINNTFLIVFDFRTLQTMFEYYNQTNTDQENRILNGYLTTVRSYIYKFDFNNSVAEKFFNDYWTTQNNEKTRTKKEAFDNSQFPFFLLSVSENQIASTQQNPGTSLAPDVQKSEEELLNKLAELVVTRTIKNLEENNFMLQAAHTVNSVKPVITAELNQTRDIKFDSQFVVYENRILQNGSIQPVRIATVKSMNGVEPGIGSLKNKNVSSFYQIAGKKINTNGMFLKKKTDAGINLVAGNTFNGLSAATGRFEYYFSRTMKDMVKPGKTGKGLTSIKLYFEGGQKKKTYLLNEIPENFTFTRGSIGIGKDYYPLPFMHWGPFTGYGIESAKWENSENLISTNFAEVGARMGVNLLHNLQIIGSATYYHLIHSVLMNGNRDVLEPDYNYTGTFSDRSKMGYNIAIRLML